MLEENIMIEVLVLEMDSNNREVVLILVFCCNINIMFIGLI